MVFAEAEEDVALRAAIQYRDFGYGTPILVGRTDKVLEKLLGPLSSVYGNPVLLRAVRVQSQ